jgi:aryl-alcohol dehydrogenase-like predicted oxidoreductase
VNWFDVAPSYGDGEAEAIFGSFAVSRRDRVHICTKVGIAPGAVNPVIRALKPLARSVATVVPGLRSMIARGRSGARSVPIDGKLILSSIEDSLRRLRTDHVDVLALHDPGVEVLVRDDVLRALEATVASGKARAVGIAGAPTAVRVAVEQCLPLTHVQFAAGPFGVNLSEMGSVIAGGRSVVVHSVLVAVVTMQRRLANSAPAVQPLLVRHGYDMAIGAALRCAMLDHALASNPEGIVLVSAFQRSHLDFALDRVKSHDGDNAASLLRCLHALAAPD